MDLLAATVFCPRQPSSTAIPLLLLIRGPYIFIPTYFYRDMFAHCASGLHAAGVEQQSYELQVETSLLAYFQQLLEVSHETAAAYPSSNSSNS